MQELISVDIIEQITDKRPVLMEQLLGDIETLKNPYTLLDKLREIAHHNQVRMIRAPPPPPASSATALATVSKKRKFVSCNNGRHNPKAPHDESKCWTLHPELRPQKKKEATSHATVTQTQTDDRAEYYAYATGNLGDRSNNVILDSGASQHMFNSM
jgi:hypothetical protein